jgi:hypothetical protein
MIGDPDDAGDMSEEEYELMRLRIVPSVGVPTIRLSDQAQAMRAGQPAVPSGNIDRLDPVRLVEAAHRTMRMADALADMTIMPARVEPEEVGRRGLVPPFELQTAMVSEDGTMKVTIGSGAMVAMSLSDEFNCSLLVSPEDVERARVLPQGACVALEGRNCTALLRPGRLGRPGRPGLPDDPTAHLSVTMRRSRTHNQVDMALMGAALRAKGVDYDTWPRRGCWSGCTFEFDVHQWGIAVFTAQSTKNGTPPRLPTRSQLVLERLL